MPPPRLHVGPRRGMSSEGMVPVPESAMRPVVACHHSSGNKNEYLSIDRVNCRLGLGLGLGLARGLFGEGEACSPHPS